MRAEPTGSRQSALWARSRSSGHGTTPGSATVELTCRDASQGPPGLLAVPDHNAVAEWGLWVGRPLLGQWVWDIIRWLDFLDEERSGKG